MVGTLLGEWRITELPSENAALVRGANHDYQALAPTKIVTRVECHTRPPNIRQFIDAKGS